MALVFLTKDDFKINAGNRGNILCTEVPGFSFILFYSVKCSHCQNVIPIFKKLPNSITGCTFGMVKVSKNKELVETSRNTIAPIQYVPLSILYYNGRPFMRYDGPHEENEIRKFVYEVCNKIQQQQKVSDENENQEISQKKDPQLEIPEYTIGQPLRGKTKDMNNVCYLSFDKAYNES